MAPARSIQCIRRPPNSAPSGLASLGSTISAISDCESRTGRGERLASAMVLLFCRDCASASFAQVSFQKTLRHLLNADVLMPAEPTCCREIEFQFSLTRGTVGLFVYVSEAENSRWGIFSGNWIRLREPLAGAATANLTASQRRSAGAQPQLL